MINRNYRNQFPDFKLSYVIPEGFTDTSWKNDTCPSWINEEHNIKLFIEYDDPEKRENLDEDQFYVVQYETKDYDCMFEARELTTHDYPQVLRCIDGWINNPIKLDIPVKSEAVQLQDILANMFGRVCVENGYELLSMDDLLASGVVKNVDHYEVIEAMGVLWVKLEEYETEGELFKRTKEADTLRIKKDLNEYLDKYTCKGEDTATLIGDLL